MYGHKRYGKTIKPTEQIAVPAVDSNTPTFVCSRCHRIKLQVSGYTDIFLTLQIKPNDLYRICVDCSVLLQTWINV